MAQGAIRGIRYDENFAYILKNENDFLYTEYKFLQNQLGNIFIRCMQTKYNGKIQLYYLTGRYKMLKDVIYRLDESSFLHIVESLMYDIADKAVVLTKKTKTAMYATNMLPNVVNISDTDKYTVLCNDCLDKSAVSLDNLNFSISEYIGHIENCDSMSVNVLSQNKDMEK